MRIWTLLSVGLGVLALGSTAAQADPWKDESGNGRPRYVQPYYAVPAPVVVVPVPAPLPYYAPIAEPIPSGHLPPPGECRAWYPGVPAGQQPPPHRC